ncbi:hypothetical protein ACIO3O_00135 [Streptomyces sp. NPDC087440]|uniref:hypothetical protein n=1 Tax=Streptomyces sp. NPDC087440 TaxID=3365790 RepID=UPI00382261E2
MDLLDWHRGRLSSRRLAVLVRHPPQDSASARELNGEAADWSVTDYLLARAVDHLAEANWMYATVNQDEDAERLEYPVPVVRPGTGVREPDEDLPSKSGTSGPAASDPAASGPSVAEMVCFFG